MDYLTNYYKNLSEQLQERINVLESFMPKKQGMPPFGLPWPMPPSTKNIPVDQDEEPIDPNHGPPVPRPQDRKPPRDKLGKYDPKKKIAKKDYDKDGKVESSDAEWRGSRDRAIKQAMKER
jgi:hypothetical protein